jgi:hypothetical protein
MEHGEALTTQDKEIDHLAATSGKPNAAPSRGQQPHSTNNEYDDESAEESCQMDS